MPSTPRAILLLLVLAPLTVRAQTPPDATPPDTAPQEALPRAVPPPEPTQPARVEAPAHVEVPPRPAEARRWSLGAGVGFGVSQVSLGVVPGPVLLGVTAPTASASLERELSPRSWLVLGANGMLAQLSIEGAGPSYDENLVAAGASIGVRNVVTAPGAPVDLSTVLLAEGGLARAVVTPEPTSGAPRLQRSWRIGASFGIAIDRELTPGLSLRVATPLVQGAYSDQRVEYVAAPPTRSSGFTVGVVVAPRLELRIAY
jgi:hypothetical protein